jgi:hypothetical protein
VRSGADGRFRLAVDQTSGDDASLYLIAKGGTPAASASGGDKPGDRLAGRARHVATIVILM